MATRLLETKLHPPQRRPGLVTRSRLTDRLTRAAASKLTLVSAPPGFGKTTLVADWLASHRPQSGTAWLSLDSRDNDPVSFWTYVVAALQTAVLNLGEAAMSAILSPQPDLDLALQALLNDLAALPGDLVLVLDDFHLIDAREVHERMAFALDRLPPACPRRHRHPLRSSAAPRPPAGAGRARRSPSGGSALHQGRGRGLLPERDGPRVEGGRRGRARSADRGLDRGAPARRAIDAGTRGHRIVHRLVRRRRPLCRRLPG